MSCSPTAALPAGSSACTGKGAAGGPFSAVAPELGEEQASRVGVWIQHCERGWCVFPQGAAEGRWGLINGVTFLDLSQIPE